jgi:predicted GNAT superfamily acetyltransferase
MDDTFPEGRKIIAEKGRRFLLRVEDSSDSAEYAKYDELRQVVWGFPDDHLAGTRNMMCENFLHEGSSLFIAAYAEDEDGRFVEDAARLAGFAYGFVGVRDKSVAFASTENLWFYAQYTAVRPEAQGFDLGVRIKEFQAEIVRDVLGVGEMVCTFDPLTGVNAYRNIHRFGMSVLEYRAATYGEYGGHLNRQDVPTDRFFMSWDLRSGRSGRTRESEPVFGTESETLIFDRVEVAGKTRTVELERVGKVQAGGDSPAKIIPVPADFYLMLRETDVADAEVRRIPLAWRMATRGLFQDLLARGYRIADFVRLAGRPARNVYILRLD